MKKINLKNPAVKLWIFALIMILIVAFGVIGFRIIEKWDYLDALYMTIITLTTIGFGEIKPLSSEGRLFTIILIAGGMSAIVFAARSATQILLEGQLQKYIGRRKMERSVRKMKNHYILCGFGRTGRKICDELRTANVSYVVVERKQEVFMELESYGVMVIQGEATDDDVLIAAGVKDAKCLISAVDSPADNVFITLTARGLNSKLHIVARAESVDTEKKLFRAGASKVVLPHAIGGRQMALAALRPSMVQFLELEFLREKYGVQMEEIHISKQSVLTGLSLKDAAISQRFGLVVIGIINRSKGVIFNPGSHQILEADDDLILFGDNEQLKRLESVASGSETLPELS
ncbi:potassium channel protein [bacterium]|nr:potassium channel protein [candidate division CSSED10-310 bacterium]